VGWNPAHGEMYSMQHYDEVGKWLAAGQRFSPGTLVSITFDRHDKAEILLKVALIIWTQTWLKCYIYNTQEANEKFE
jgi:hypothetical protein